MDKNTIFSVEGGGESRPATKEQLTQLEKEYKSNSTLLMQIMTVVVVVVVVTFLIEISAMQRNYAQDKSILLQMNEQNYDYFDKVLLLDNEINDLKLNIEVLKAKNSHLK